VYAARLSLLSLIALVGLAQQASAIPADDLLNSLKPTADVNDYAGLLTPAERESLEARCRLLRQRTGAQLAVVTLKSLEGGQIDDFANKLFKRWSIGEKGKDNGILLLVAVDDRQMRIEVGYGLEPIVPDALAGRIVQNQLRPNFRNQQYAAGLTAAVNALSELVENGEPAPEPSERQPGAGLAILFLALFVAVGAFALGVGLGIPEVRQAVFGALFGGVAMLAGVAAAGPVALAIHIPLAIICAVMGWKLAQQADGDGGRPWRHTDWNWGDFSSGSGGGWSSGGGGFSQSWGGFGGGSSGGGGASGSW
jgi:uncharacterized protein